MGKGIKIGQIDLIKWYRDGLRHDLSLSEVVGVLAKLPVSHPVVEAFELISLVREEGLNELLAEDSGHVGIRLKGIERRRKITGKLVGLARVVAVALERWRRLELVADPEVGRGKKSGGREVGIGAGVPQPELHAGRLAPLRRNPHHRAPVVKPPVHKPW